mmetsp:Transcript_68289/g.99930  ORF Transcript_68289/g.99930 Transcript_68289/m.99930 type:complete len:90 (+) Transcript_68289:41-310(+)
MLHVHESYTGVCVLLCVAVCCSMLHQHESCACVCVVMCGAVWCGVVWCVARARVYNLCVFCVCVVQSGAVWCGVLHVHESSMCVHLLQL